ncbi:ecto-ADP-ribosyltransferase 5-like [Centropristis striata]|uniref:ecto-ADP-ribosyltransferase 5-like n=1 Tax=Centropristis striata TaxID=184440 RepID=UPI0027DF918D|nr:ecto-ADP-ribosyltransferase 5-like [Centropristis striata]
MTMLLVLAAVLLTDGVSAANTVNSGVKRYLPLNLALKSVDDMYDGCKDKMDEAVKGYLQNQLGQFRSQWDWAMNQEQQEPASSSLKKQEAASSSSLKKEEAGSSSLKKEEAAAILVYTSSLYVDFNNAVRSQKSQYKKSFQYHTLHFYLTSAIQALRSHRLSFLRPGDDGCLSVFRRTDRDFRRDVVNKNVRFGSFASSSLDTSQVSFGDSSCFEVVTCLGADISMFSMFPQEREVLIPPYEVFKVVQIKKRSQQPDLPCEVVYTLSSTKKPVSKLNCALFKKKKQLSSVRHG